MARQISPAMRPYVELQRSLPKGTPFSERARAAKELKMQLAHQHAEAPVYHWRRSRSRRNPNLLGLGLLGLGGWYVYEHFIKPHEAAAQPNTPTQPVANTPPAL